MAFLLRQEGLWIATRTFLSGDAMIGKKTTLILSNLSETKGTDGVLIKTWTDIMEIEGVLRPVSGNEQFVSGKWVVKNNFSFRCEVPVNITIDERMKFKLKGTTRSFDIVNADDVLEQGIFNKIDLLERK